MSPSAMSPSAGSSPTGSSSTGSSSTESSNRSPATDDRLTRRDQAPADPASPKPDRDLASVVDFAETEAERLLDTDGAPPLDVVAWLSAHMAALDRTVYPVAKRAIPDGPRLVGRQREISSRLARLLRVVERRHSGDVLASGLSSDRLSASLRTLLDEHHAAEREMLDGLAATLDDDAKTALVESYESAMKHAPTRPHPHLSRGGLMFRFDSLRDRILDAMDGRHVPIPRLAHRRIVPGRWGAYFLGQPHHDGQVPHDNRDTG